MGLLSALFACRHNRTTFPMRLRGEREAHVNCLECGRKFVYDWPAMRRGEEILPEISLTVWTPESEGFRGRGELLLLPERSA
jgi:hypothetical protein